MGGFRDIANTAVYGDGYLPTEAGSNAQLVRCGPDLSFPLSANKAHTTQPPGIP